MISCKTISQELLYFFSHILMEETSNSSEKTFISKCFNVHFKIITIRFRNATWRPFQGSWVDEKVHKELILRWTYQQTVQYFFHILKVLTKKINRFSCVYVLKKFFCKNQKFIFFTNNFTFSQSCNLLVDCS